MCNLVAGYAVTLQRIASPPQGSTREQFTHSLVDTSASGT